MSTLPPARRKLLALVLWALLSLAPAASSLAICGDTVLDGGEQCDDGNTLAGDCCSATCQYESFGSSCDVDACNTGGSCDGAGVCGGTSPVVCDDGAFCNGAESCDPGLGCQAGTPPTNDDGVFCTDEVCDEVGDVVNNVANDANCDDALLCNGAETCDAVLDCQPGAQPGLGVLFRRDLVMSDPRSADPMLDPIIIQLDPMTGAQQPLTIGGVLTEPRDVAVEANRCVLVPDDNISALVRVDPLTYDPMNPGDNQVIVSQYGDLSSPRGITIAPNGDIYLADHAASSQIIRIDPFTGGQEVVGRAGHLNRPRRIAIGSDGLLYVPIPSGSSRPAVVRIDPAAFDPFDDFANQEIVASGGLLNVNNGPWDLEFDENGMLIVLNAQKYNLIRVDVDAYNPLDEFANQEEVADGGTFTEMRGLTVEETGLVVVTDEGNSTVVRVDPDAFDVLDEGSNQTIIASGPPMTEPRGIDVVGIGTCGNGSLDAGEQCDDGNETDGDCCSSLCQYESNGNACDVDACSVGGTCNATGSCLGTSPVSCDDTLYCNGLETCDPVFGCQDGPAPVVDDGVVCTDDVCDEVGDVVTNTVNHANCDDLLFCNGLETCDAVLDCQNGPPPVVDDGVACTNDSCDEVGDVVVNAPDDDFCSDGIFCNGVEACDPVGGCQPTVPLVIDDGVACTDDSCDEVGDVVIHAPNNSLCDDSLFCNGVESCDPVLDCQAGAPPTNDDGVFCTDEICDEVGDVINNVANDANCDDTLLCNGIETCDAVLDCQDPVSPGLGALFRHDIVMSDPRSADPLLDPIIIRVDRVTGAQQPLTIGGFLTEPRDVAVEANRCVLVPDDNISALVRVDPLTYDPMNPGDNQVIVSQYGDLNSPRGITIAPNGDIYLADHAAASQIIRIDPDTGAQEVVGRAGHLNRPRRIAIGGDGMLYVPIPSGSSRPAVVRIDPAAFDPFDDLANQEIVASGGFFVFNNGPWDLEFDENGMLIVLNAQDWNVIRVDVDAYDPLDEFANQEVVADGGTFTEMRGLTVEENGDVIVTDEGNSTVVRVNPDTFDIVNPGTNQSILASGLPMTEPRGVDIVGIGSCGNGVVDPGEQCDDGNEADGDCCSAVCSFETSGSSCNSGICFTGGAGTCDGAGTCQGSNPIACDDGVFCNGAEGCDPVLGCQAGAPPVIDDGVACTDDSCDEVGDVVVNAPNDSSCDNGQFCDGAEVCHATLDCQPGAPPSLGDGVVCTDDSCDEVGDVVVHAPNDGNCDNGQFCDGAETCHATLDCQAGTPPSLDDGVACTDDSCDEVGDVVVNTPNDGNCDNGQFCDGSETCHASLDCQSGAPPNLDDGVPCTDDSCDEVGDVVVNTPNDANCDNGVFCDGAETCDAGLDCQAGTPPEIDDGIACTDDSCDEVADMVVHVPMAAACDDGLSCTEDGCDVVTGCYNDPIPQCNAAVDTLPPSGRLWLIVILALSAAAFLGGRRAGQTL